MFWMTSSGADNSDGFSDVARRVWRRASSRRLGEAREIRVVFP